VANEEFTESDYEARKAALEAAGNQLTDELFEYGRRTRACPSSWISSGARAPTGRTSRNRGCRSGSATRRTG
jgi:hypothetical protein